MIGATLRACRNELCSEAQIFSLPTEAEWEGPRLLMEGELVVKAHVYTLPTEHTVTARILAQGHYPHGLADGDVYSLMLRDNTSVLSEKSWTATYRVLEPNGHECGPTCLSATLVDTTSVSPCPSEMVLVDGKFCIDP